MRKNISDLPGGDDAIEIRLRIARLTRIETQPIDWDAFWKLPSGNVHIDTAVQAAIDCKGDR